MIIQQKWYEGDMRWDGHHGVDLLAFLVDDSAAPFCNFTAQHLMAILGDPADREVDGKGRMGAMAIITHTPQSTKNLLELPPKGGVLPLPIRDNK
jgi:hypothetical protein